MSRLALTTAFVALLTPWPWPWPRLADACGGCFSPPQETTTVEGHRMVVALSPWKTVLWDQITYAGDPADFVWVLPVPSTEVTVELAEAAFFDGLDAGTAPLVRPLSPSPFAVCSNAAACGGGAGGGAAPSDGDDDPSDGVTVHDRQTVGPYESVTLTGESSTALHDWLTGHGYAVPEPTLPTIQFYVDKRSAFVVLRLRPGQGVNAMEPVRIAYPGYMASFPLKMVTVGAAGALELALWVIAEQRYETRNYPTVEIDPAELTWDWATGRSNYAELFGATIERAGGRAWVVEHADRLATVPVPPGDDLTTANQLQPHPFVTRLRTRMLVDHMDEDLALAPAADAEPVSRELYAPIDLNRPAEVQCPDGTGGTCLVGLGRRASSTLTALVLGLLAILTVGGTCSRAWSRRRARRSATSCRPPSGPPARTPG